jgi:hypothetical protein
MSTIPHLSSRCEAYAIANGTWEPLGIGEGGMLAVFPDRFFCEGDHIAIFIASARAQGEAEPVLEGEISTRITNQKRRQRLGVAS